MDPLTRELSRRQFLKATGAAGLAVGLGGIVAACSSGSSTTSAPSAAAASAAAASAAASSAPSATAAPNGTFNWMTWSDHWYQAQLDAVASTYGIKASATSFSDNIDAYTKLKEVGGQLDMVSGDALWVPHYYESGLIEAWDINSLKVAQQLYSVARSFPIWTKPEGYLGYPFGWSPVQIYYDPAHVSPAPDSWEVLLDPKYAKRVIVEDQPVEIMAYMGKLAGAKDPYNMTPDEISQAKGLLKQLKPNVLPRVCRASGLTGIVSRGLIPPITGLTLRWYAEMVRDGAIHAAVFNSIEVAAIVTLLATIIGTMAAFPLVRGGIRSPGTGRLLFTMPIMIPGVLIGIGIINVPPGHPSTPPVVLGHEFVGRIRAAGPTVRGAVIGTRVVVDPDPKCGSCDSCRGGRPANCTKIVALGVHRDGALARFVTTPVATVYPISETVPAQLAALVEPLACVVNGTNRAALRPGERVVVFGAGAIGCLFVAVLRAAGASSIVAVEPSLHRAPVAHALGADIVVTPEEWSARRTQLVSGGADVVVDAVGSVLPQAIDAAGIGARVVVFGMNGNARPQVHQIEIVEKGLSILGSYISNFTFPVAIRPVESGQLNLAPMITATLPLDETPAGLARIRSGEAMKIIITP